MVERVDRDFRATVAGVRSILLVDADTDARRELVGQLELHTNDRILDVASGKHALALAEKSHVNLILIDAALPDMDGRELCRVLRFRDFAGPIVLLSAASSDADTILGLDSGATDFVTKPYRFCVLLARLRAHLRQFERSEDAVLAIGAYFFHAAGRWLAQSDGRRKVTLTVKEAALLRYLYLNSHRTIDLKSIMRDVWGYHTDLETHTAQTHVYRLRQKIEPDPSCPQMIVTVPGGYRLINRAKPEAGTTWPAARLEPHVRQSTAAEVVPIHGGFDSRHVGTASNQARSVRALN
jgi:DNA-binding response OmpR family regulator